MIIEPLDCRTEDPVGGKARSLASLTQAGFEIPDWFIVTPDDYQLPPLNGLHAVRSSAMSEDGSENSFAGQFDSFLNISPDDVEVHIEKVRQSGTSSHLETYARTREVEMKGRVSVIVQKMVDAKFAGVAFGADPITGERAITIVSAIEGLGEALVSGEIDSENWRISPTGEIEGASKLLTKEQIVEVSHLCRRCNAHFGCPQDIEWAIDQKGRLWLLQSRPITTLAKLPDPSDPLTVWDNSNIAESYGGVTSPLTFSFASRIYEHVYREFCKLLKVPRWKIEGHNQVFPQMLGHINGRVYYNLVSWYQVLALLPGFTINRTFMEKMMGVKQPLPDEIIDQIIANNSTSRWRDGIALFKTTLGLVYSYFKLPRQIKGFQHRLNDALRVKVPLSRFSRSELISHYRELEDKLLHRWDAPLVNDFFAMIFYGLLAKNTDDPNAFLRDTGDIISARPPRLIKEMAALARPHPQLTQTLLSDTPVARKLSEVREHPELNKKLQSYLEEFGDRCLEELKLESPTVLDDPGSLLQSIGTFAAHPPKETVKEPSPKPRGFSQRFLASKTRLLIRNRENLRFERTRVFGRVRNIVRELGNRLVADRQLESSDDVFYLTLDEILDSGVTRDLTSLASLRKKEFYNHHQSSSPPDRFNTRGPLYRHREFLPEESHEDTKGDLKGIGACAGIVRGPVRVVTTPREATLQPGEILVATQTDPGWVVLFPAAAGLLVERGSLLSHSAIVARELDLPCVVSLTNITTTLKTGDLVEMNGKTGEVTLLNDEN
jgi:pyruvate,water dikinase